MIRVRVLAPGPPGHGVVRHAAAVAGLVAAHGVASTAFGPADLTHAQFTDALWGPDVARAADAFAKAVAETRRPLLVTLHDVPGADPDPARDARRVAGYRAVTAAADAVVVSAVHEAAKVRAFGGPDPHVLPLPLPTTAAPGPAPAWSDRPTLGVLGFVYPGKGHAEAIDAAARHPSRPRVVVAGAVAPGHDDLWTDLCTRAADRDVELHRTGTLTEPDLAAAAAATTVPVAANPRASASGSLLAWIAHGRVPLAADGSYTREVASTAPGSVWPYDGPDALDTAVAAGLADPARTRRRGPVRWPDAGAGHAALYTRLLAGARC